MDYGHDLLFGNFITPAAERPQHAVELAVVAEQAGLDLVSFQDHPYQPGFLDTWTLLTYVAARTSRIRLSHNVLNLPLRPPVMLARAAASVDLLSAGRFELGIGAGRVWDAIESMGGPRRSPGEAVEALEEAITIIREVWAADKPGPVFVDGKHYRVRGAARGPSPAHDVGIWVGAGMPRMLRLVGRRADGWSVPARLFLPGGPPALAEPNRMIDAAATAAGRDPSAVRRILTFPGRFSHTRGGLLDGTPAQWAEDLADMAVRYGIGTFVLGSDDPETTVRYAAEVVPATRELVAAKRRAAAA
ncbi:MAG TPA: LLM class flavin-dependent oxidoreductase [Gaiellaceae bacterium]|nr:LLM class flavin-dependent oxidoreductase [Gaiellaceae bacterium]